jgi:LCP family protein required for cell wall assembly
MGIDARPGQSGGNGDALHVVGVNSAAGQATVLNIPRDTWVPIPGRGDDKINSAFASGGAVAEAKAVSSLVGAPISFVVQTDFAGFTGMVDELGGIDVNVPYPMHDPLSGAHFDPGPTHLNGADALAFARDRHLGDGDITRTADQALLLIAALSKLRTDSAAATIRDLAVLVRHARLDGISITDAFKVGRLALSFDPGQVRSVTMPSRVGMVGSASVVFVGDGAASLFQDFADDAVLENHS